jgi:hypothetical protein
MAYLDNGAALVDLLVIGSLFVSASWASCLAAEPNLASYASSHPIHTLRPIPSKLPLTPGRSRIKTPDPQTIQNQEEA